MKPHTEKELLTQNQQYAFKLRELYFTDEKLFYQVNEYLPFPVHINKKNSFDIYYTNNRFNNIGPEMDMLLEKGQAYLPEMSCPLLLKNATRTANRFNKRNDVDEVCNHLQQIRVRNKMTYFFSNKLILDKEMYFNISHFVKDMGAIGRLIENILGPVHQNQVVWNRFQSLTKQEKRILKMLSNGKTNSEVADNLFISSGTVKTHRRNIYRKLDIHKTSDLVRFSLVLELL